MRYADLNNMVNPIVNISEKERLVSGIAGGLMLALGVFGFGKSSFRRAVRMTAGSLLIMRGLSGYCPMTAMRNAEMQPNVHEKTENFVAG